MRLVERARSGEPMASLCREFGISRKTGYKMLARYAAQGEAGLLDEERRPKRVARRTAAELEERIVALRREHPDWGPRVLRSVLVKEHAEVKWPSRSTFANILRRHQLSKPQRRRRRIMRPTKPFAHAQASNDVWCIDYKGQFKVGNGATCYPLTVTDAHSRYLLVCEGFERISWEDVKRSLWETFEKHGLPRAIRSDNGSPFASARSTWGWSRFTPWLMRLGIEHERIEPGHPEQNGRHERMHRTLKAATIRPAAKTVLAQQERFDQFREEYNEKRPHQGLGEMTPGSVYRPSPRRRPKQLPEPSYPLHDRTCRVLAGGIVRLHGRHRFALTSTLVGEHIGARELADGRWLITFVDVDLGHYDERTRRFEPTDQSLEVEPTSKELDAAE